jgi:hypothetical protein
MLRVQPKHLVRLLALAYPYFDGGGRVLRQAQGEISLGRAGKLASTA